jgi:uncharacterized protein DUF2441
MDTSNTDQTGWVEDQDYYHINRIVDWSPYGPLQVGDHLDVGTSSNPYFRFFETATMGNLVTHADGSTEEVPGVKFLELVLGGKVKATLGTINFTRELASHLARHLGEVLFENIRRSEFPHLPSRQRCVWLTPIRIGVKYWLRRMSVGGQFQVLKVRIRGRLHRANENYLITDSFSQEEMIRRARLYWGGVDNEEETQEIIFAGRMRVEEVMPPDFYA